MHLKKLIKKKKFKKKACKKKKKKKIKRTIKAGLNKNNHQAQRVASLILTSQHRETKT